MQLKDYLGLKYDPRYFQEQAYNNFFNHISNPCNAGKHPLIVLPTGAGKSLVQAMIIKRLMQWPNTRFLALTHQQELIKQNYNELLDNTSDIFVDAGIYSAGLKKRDLGSRITFAGIQSVYKRPWELGYYNIICIDEAHRVPTSSEKMYTSFLNTMIEKINPHAIIVGLTATEFRLKSGLLYEGEGRLFHSVCHKTTMTELINPNDPRNLDNEQYLCNLISQPAENQADLSSVQTVAGEYNQRQMEAKFTEGELIKKAVAEIKKKAADRKKILAFTSGVKHCEEVAAELNRQGIVSDCIHYENKNEQAINHFKEGRIRCLVNIDKLTTGFNVKAVDCIPVLRGTKSASLIIQIFGRGSRLHPDKKDCLCLDFGGNIDYFGPIDKIEIKPKKPKQGPALPAPTKTCPECGNPGLHISITTCPTCGYVFQGSEKHDETASTGEILSTYREPSEFEIDYVEYNCHFKQGKPPSVKISYYSGRKLFIEFLHIEHSMKAAFKAKQWLSHRLPQEVVTNIKTTKDILDVQDRILKPVKLLVDTNPKYPEIKGYTFVKKEEETEKQPDTGNMPVGPTEVQDVAELIF